MPRLLAVCKTATGDGGRGTGRGRAARVRRKLRAGSRGQASGAGCGSPALEWHLIGHLQSNKAAEAAALFDWVQTVDRAKLVAALARHRPAAAPPLNVLIQVNIDDEASKHGCRPEDVPALADAIAARAAPARCAD